MNSSCLTTENAKKIVQTKVIMPISPQKNAKNAIQTALNAQIFLIA